MSVMKQGLVDRQLKAESVKQFALLHRVHTYVRGMFTYVPEEGTRTCWRTPQAFMLNLGGDCEDFAVYTYHLLKCLGYKKEDLRLAHVRTEGIKGEGRDHTILLARTAYGCWLTLDNRFYSLSPEDFMIRGGRRMVYSFNESGLWVGDVHWPNRYPPRWRELMVHM